MNIEEERGGEAKVRHYVKVSCLTVGADGTLLIRFVI